MDSEGERTGNGGSEFSGIYGAEKGVAAIHMKSACFFPHPTCFSVFFPFGHLLSVKINQK